MRNISVLLTILSLFASFGMTANADETAGKQLNTAVLQVEAMT